MCKRFWGWNWVRGWGPNELSSLGLGGKTFRFGCIRDGPCWSHVDGCTLARPGDPDCATWWLHLVRVTGLTPIVWTIGHVLLGTPGIFTEIGTTLHIGWVLEYYLSYACVLLLLCEMTELCCDVNCNVYISTIIELCCVTLRGRTRKWCNVIPFITFYS